MNADLDTIGHYLKRSVRDNPECVSEIQAAIEGLSNLLSSQDTRIAKLEKSAGKSMEWLNEALNSGDGTYKP